MSEPVHKSENFRCRQARLIQLLLRTQILVLVQVGQFPIWVFLHLRCCQQVASSQESVQMRTMEMAIWLVSIPQDSTLLGLPATAVLQLRRLQHQSQSIPRTTSMQLVVFRGFSNECHQQVRRRARQKQHSIMQLLPNSRWLPRRLPLMGAVASMWWATLLVV